MSPRPSQYQLQVQAHVTSLTSKFDHTALYFTDLVMPAWCTGKLVLSRKPGCCHCVDVWLNTHLYETASEWVMINAKPGACSASTPGGIGQHGGGFAQCHRQAAVVLRAQGTAHQRAWVCRPNAACTCPLHMPTCMDASQAVHITAVPETWTTVPYNISPDCFTAWITNAVPQRNLGGSSLGVAPCLV